jgi:hypothetical protein
MLLSTGDFGGSTEIYSSTLAPRSLSPTTQDMLVHIVTIRPSFVRLFSTSELPILSGGVDVLPVRTDPQSLPLKDF